MNKDALHNHVTPIPHMLAHFYSTGSADLITEKYTIRDIEKYPSIGAKYRANTTGILYVVDSIALVEHQTVTPYEYMDACDLRKISMPQDARIVLKSVEPSGITLIVTKDDFFSRIPSYEHYTGLRAVYECDRYEKIDDPEPLPLIDRLYARYKTPRKVVARDITEVAQVLENGPGPLYVINTHVTRHGMADIIFECPSDISERARPDVVVIPATWIPIDVLTFVPRQVLASNSTFLNLLRQGVLTVIHARDYRRVMERPEAKEELERIQEKYPNRMFK